MSVSFCGFDEKFLTFKAATGLTAGEPVKMSANNTVAACSSGDAFIGIAVNVRNGYATVQMGGYATLTYSSTAPTVGVNLLAADDSGGVAVSQSGGKAVLAVNVNATASTVGIIF